MNEVGAGWRLEGRVAVVTGASAGLGARFARVLHAAGAHVIATARRADLLDQLVQECGSRIETLAGDITDPVHRQELAELAGRHGRIDVLVNNAGICDGGPIEQQTLDDLRQVIEVNLVSTLDIGRLTAGLLRAAPAASVINVASIYGVVASALRWLPTTPPRPRSSASPATSPRCGVRTACASTLSRPAISPPT